MAPSTDQIYDRQIRLWGSEAQSRMMNSKIAFVNLTGLTSEVLKNVVLAGIKCTLISVGDREVCRDDVFSNLFLRKGEEGGNNVEDLCRGRVQELNVHTKVEHYRFDDMEAFLATLPTAQYTLIVSPSLSLSIPLSQLLSKTCRMTNTSLILCDTFGFEACSFLQVGGEEGHTYRKEAGKDKLSDPITSVYPCLDCADGIVDWEGLKNRFGGVPKEWVAWMIGRMGRGKKGEEWKSFAENTLTSKNLPSSYLTPNHLTTLPTVLYASPSIVPVCAVFGGQLGQEVLKMLTCKGEVAWNFMTFNGETQIAREVRVGPGDGKK